jgi:hypothetical protein
MLVEEMRQKLRLGLWGRIQNTTTESWDTQLSSKVTVGKQSLGTLEKPTHTPPGEGFQAFISPSAQGSAAKAGWVPFLQGGDHQASTWPWPHGCGAGVGKEPELCRARTSP